MSILSWRHAAYILYLLVLIHLIWHLLVHIILHATLEWHTSYLRHATLKWHASNLWHATKVIHAIVLHHSIPIGNTGHIWLLLPRLYRTRRLHLINLIHTGWRHNCLLHWHSCPISLPHRIQCLCIHPLLVSSLRIVSHTLVICKSKL